MKKNITTYSTEYSNSTLSFTSGKFAFRTDSEVLARHGDTSILVTLTVDKDSSKSDFFPLTVEFVDKHYATGNITDNRYQKREKTTDDSILKARAIDRAIRPLFPKDLRNPVLIVVTLLSFDKVNDPMPLAINAVSIVVQKSRIPFNGPVCAARIAMVDNVMKASPDINDLKESSLDLLITGNKDTVSMIEFEGKIIEKYIVKDAFNLAIDEFAKIEKIQKSFLDKATKVEKLEQSKSLSDEDILKSLIGKTKKAYGEFIDNLTVALYDTDDDTYAEKIQDIKKSLKEKNTQGIEDSMIDEIIYHYSRDIMREGILESGKRLSGRALDEIREISAETSVIPIVHGSALFSRGITQSLSITTLGPVKDEEYSESYLGAVQRNYIHHYNGASFSLGEASRFSLYPGRREIGHGELAEKAVKPVLPDIQTFPYTIRVVSEILSQSGSSSMAATCGSCMSLMDAGVPLRDVVGGIAIGLVTRENKKTLDYKLVVDMQDKEDFFGDMDFKLTGTTTGVTAIQMDNKLGFVPMSILLEAIDLAHMKVVEVISKIKEVIPEPRKQLSSLAPIVYKIQIPTDKIGAIIGSGGKNIKELTEKTGSTVDISDNGVVMITALNADSLTQTLLSIKEFMESSRDDRKRKPQNETMNKTGSTQIGQIYSGSVKDIKDFGIFVELETGFIGLVHKNELLNSENIPNTYPIGKSLKIKVKGMDSKNRLVLSEKVSE